MRHLALGGVGGPLLFSVMTIVTGALRGEYSHLTQFISELGADGTPYSGLMNYAGFVPAGLLIAGFGAALATTLPRDRFRLAAAILVALFGIGVTADGLLSCDPGCPQTGGTLANLLHNRIAPVAFLCAIAAAGTVGLRYQRCPGWHSVARYSLLTSVVALGWLLALASSFDTRTLTGLWQRLLLATLFLWCAVLGLRAHAGHGALSAPPGPEARPTRRGR